MAEIARKIESKPRITKDQVLAVSEAGNDSLGVIQSRFQAMGHYLDTPVPNRAEHLWRYSDPARFLPRMLPDASPTRSVSDGGTDISLFADRPPRIRPVIPKGVVVAPLSTSLEGARLIGGAVSLDHGILESLNGALWSQGIFIHISEGVRIDRPLRIRRIASSPFAVTRLVISVAPGAEVAVVEDHTGGGEVTVVAVTELFAGEDARVSHTLLQQWDKGTTGHVTSRARLARDALVRSQVISLGGTRYKADVGAVLDGVGAESELSGVSLVDGRRHIDLHTVHDHRGERTRSRIEYKAALLGRSTSAYTGLIRVAESAELSEAFQENRNLLLSDRCQADSIPELEIETNEVQCTHAATAAPIDADQLFYLRSRGIPEAEAVGIIVEGFFEAALGAVPESLRPEVRQSVTRRLADQLSGGRR